VINKRVSRRYRQKYEYQLEAFIVFSQRFEQALPLLNFVSKNANPRKKGRGISLAGYLIIMDYQNGDFPEQHNLFPRL
jgi:hypothetical protein